jgi:hypothetical protein
MAHLFIDGLPFLLAWWILPWQTLRLSLRQVLLHGFLSHGAMALPLTMSKHKTNVCGKPIFEGSNHIYGFTILSQLYYQ